MPKTAVIYARFSCSKQREASIDDQLRECRAWCEREGIEVVREYCDHAVSGRTDERPEFQRMISSAGESDLVVVYMMDRFSRSEFDAPIYKRELQRHGVQLVSALERIPESPEGIIYEKLLEGLAACESRKTSVRTRRGMEGNALKSMPNGGPRPYGYRNVGGKYIVDEAEAAVVREIFERRAAGETNHRIAADLAARGVVNAQGRPMRDQVVGKIIRSRRYVGEYRWGTVVTPNAFEAIVDEALWESANEKVAARSRDRERQDYREYPLVGKALCAVCGHGLSGESAHGRGSVRYDYYTCSAHGARNHIKRTRAQWLERAVVAGIRAMLADRAEAEHIAEMVVASKTGAAVERRRAGIQADIRKADDAMRNLVRAIEEGLYTPAMRERMDELQAAKAHAEAELAMVQETTVTVEEFTEFLLSGTSMSDRQIIDCFVWSVVLDNDAAVVTLNWDQRTQKNEPARIELVRKNSEWLPIVLCETLSSLAGLTGLSLMTRESR